MKPVTIYALCSSRDRRARYVGQTCDITARLWQHRNHSHKKRTHLGRWISSVMNAGYEVQAIVLQQNAQRNSDEIEWIATLRYFGADLVNGTPGGDGFGNERSQSHRQAISNALRGKEKSASHRANLAAALAGRPLDPAHAEMLALARRLPKKKPPPATPETCAKISAALKGKVRSVEFKEKVRKAKIGVPRPQIVREKLSAYWSGRSRPDRVGFKHTPESIAKMSASHRRNRESQNDPPTHMA